MSQEQHMNDTNIRERAARTGGIGRAARRALLAAALALPVLASAQVPFATPQAAADAMIDAIATNDGAAVSRILGTDWRRLLPLDEVDREDLYRFLEKSSQSRTVEVNGRRAEMAVGTVPWTLPIPLVQAGDGRWRFDAAGARELIAERRIGANERSAIRAALAYVDAQREYAAADRNGDGVLEYAQRVISTPGRRDGLVWSPNLGDTSPLGQAYLPSDPRRGYHGYRYRILNSQGPHARGGARGYLVGNRMTAGYALLAWPVEYGVSGVTSFIVNADGVVFEQDLGPRTAAAAASIRQFNPDPAWKPVKP
jgi:hypothetical protein